MYSFARVIQLYRRKIGGTGHPPRIAEIVEDVAGDLQVMFASRNWTFFENQYDDDLWGTDTVTITSIDGSLVTVSDTWESKWLKQDLIFDGGSGRYVISRQNNDNSFIITPDYTGDTIASGTTGTIHQSRLLLPSDFGSLRGPVTLNNIVIQHVSPYELEASIIAGHNAATNLLCIQGSRHDLHGEGQKYMRLFPSESGRMRFRYSYMPDTPNLYVYKEGQAKINSSDLQKVVGSGTQWSVLPSSGINAVFESQESIMSGFPHSSDIVIATDNANMSLASDWTGTVGSYFNYAISSKLDLPPFMARVLRFMAERYAGKRGVGDQQVLAALQDAKMVDARDRNFPSGRTSDRWGAIVNGQGDSNFIVGY